MSYSPTSRPAGTFGLSFDCTRCQAETLKSPVFLLNDETGETAPYGTGCAAVLLGWATSPATAPADFDRRLHRAMELRKARLLTAERMATQAAIANPTKESIALAKSLRAELQELCS